MSVAIWSIPQKQDASSLLLPFVFLLLSLLGGMLFALTAPPGQTPDEPAHIARAGGLLHGYLLGWRESGIDQYGRPMINSGVATNTGPVLAAFGAYGLGLTDKPYTRSAEAVLSAIPWSAHPEFVAIPNTASYFPIFYIPSAAGLAITHVLHGTPLRALYAARICNSLAFSILGCLSLIFARQARAMLFITLCLPMTLWLSATCNQDGVMISAFCLSISLLTAEQSANSARYFLAAAIIACILGAKIPYILLSAILILPLRYPGVRVVRVMGGLTLAILPALLWNIVAWRVASGIFILGPPYQPGPLWPGPSEVTFFAPNVAAQLQVFVHAPWEAVLIPIQTFYTEFATKMREMVGVLGALSLVLPPAIYTMLYVAIGAGLALDCHSRGEEPVPRAIWISVALACSVVATTVLIYDAQYLSWTYVGYDRASGVQGRYLIPLLPVAGVAVGSIRALQPPKMNFLMWCGVAFVLELSLGASIYRTVREFYF